MRFRRAGTCFVATSLSWVLVPSSLTTSSEYRSSLPFYDLRHLVRPGITGWAQVKYPYGPTRPTPGRSCSTSSGTCATRDSLWTFGSSVGRFAAWSGVRGVDSHSVGHGDRAGSRQRRVARSLPRGDRQLGRGRHPGRDRRGRRLLVGRFGRPRGAPSRRPRSMRPGGEQPRSDDPFEPEPGFGGEHRFHRRKGRCPGRASLRITCVDVSSSSRPAARWWLWVGPRWPWRSMSPRVRSVSRGRSTTSTAWACRATAAEA